MSKLFDNKDYIKTATWNVFYDTKIAVLEPILEGLIKDDVVLLAMQEAYGKDIAQMLDKHGLGFFQADDCAVVWSKKHFTAIVKDVIDLSKTNYYTEKGREVNTTMPSVILCDMWGRTVLAGSYHTAPSVEAGPTKAPKLRWKSIQEVAETWARVARDADTKAIWLAGDDNIDESRIKGAVWAFWLKSNGLTELQPPSPTHGHPTRGRKIDSMRVKGLKPVTKGSVRAGGGDHRIHVRLLRWA